MQGRRPGLDGLRALAVAAVIVCHVGVPGCSWAGTVGVTVFFVLSGFLITVLLCKDESSVGAFYVRRLYRLLPALALLLVVWWAVGYVLGENHLPDVVAGASYSMNWLGLNHGALSHLWSLAVEEQFYLAWPLALLLLRRRPAFVACVLVAAVMAAPGVRWRLGGADRTDALLVGCALGLAWVSGWHWRPSGPAVAVAALVLVAPFPLPGVHDGLSGACLTAVALATVVLICRLLEQPGVLAHPALTYTGRISYGIYLWHLPVLWFLSHYLVRPYAALLGVPLTVLIAIGSYELVERRFTRRHEVQRQPERGPERAQEHAVTPGRCRRSDGPVAPGAGPGGRQSLPAPAHRPSGWPWQAFHWTPTCVHV